MQRVLFQVPIIAWACLRIESKKKPVVGGIVPAKSGDATKKFIRALHQSVPTTRAGVYRIEERIATGYAPVATLYASSSHAGFYEREIHHTEPYLNP